VLSRKPCFARHLQFAERHGLSLGYVDGNALSKPIELARRLRRARVDVLLTYLPSDTALGALAARWVGVPRVIGGLRNTGLPWHKVFALRLLHNTLLDATVSNSHEAAERFAARGFERSKLLVVPNGIELLPVPVARPERHDLRVVTVARFVEKKDHRTALEAVALAQRELAGEIELRYRLVGYGPLEDRIRGWIRELALEDTVELVLDPPEVDPFYRESDVYLGASRHEGLPNTILEAMNHGLAVVATRAGDTAWMLDRGSCGVLADPGDARALATGLVRLARDPAARARLGASAHRRVAERFSLEVFGAAYRALIDAGPNPRAATAASGLSRAEES